MALATRLLPHGVPGAAFAPGGVGAVVAFEPVVLEWVGQIFTLSAGATIAFEPVVLEWLGSAVTVTGPSYVHFDPMIFEWDGGQQHGGFTISGRSSYTPIFRPRRR